MSDHAGNRAADDGIPVGVGRTHGRRFCLGSADIGLGSQGRGARGLPFLTRDRALLEQARGADIQRISRNKAGARSIDFCADCAAFRAADRRDWRAFGDTRAGGDVQVRDRAIERRTDDALRLHRDGYPPGKDQIHPAAALNLNNLHACACRILSPERHKTLFAIRALAVMLIGMRLRSAGFVRIEYLRDGKASDCRKHNEGENAHIGAFDRHGMSPGN